MDRYSYRRVARKRIFKEIIQRTTKWLLQKKDVKELIDKYTYRITHIDSKENPEEYSRFETEVLNDVISYLENLLNKGAD